MKNGKRKGLLFYFNSIQSAIFAAVSVLVLCAVLIVTAVSLHYTQSSIFDNSVLYTQTIIRQINQNIDSYIDYMENISYMVANSADTQQYLFGSGETAPYQERLTEQFRTILKSREDIKNIGIIQKDGKFLFNDGYRVVNPNLDLSTQSWYEDTINSSGNVMLTSSHVQHVIKGERPWVITLSRGIHNYGGTGGCEGVAFIDLNYSAISELCDQSTTGSKGYVFIVDENGNIVYHPQQHQLYNELQTENIDLVMNADTDTESVMSGKGDKAKIYTISRSERTGWMVVGCMNMGELTRDSRKAQIIYLLTAIGLVIVALLISSLIARNITLPIQELRDSMLKVQNGDFTSAEVDVVSGNEIGSLNRSFNVMTKKIQELMEQNVWEQKEKRRSELKALQSQINPHFLYNTLDSIIWMAEGKKYEEVVLMTASLARLLRQSISNEDEMVSISREIEYVRSYLTIQKMRYKDKLEFEIDVESSVNRTEIIKLVLQPIIENAIYHGLKYKESKGLLIIKGYEQGENIILEIIDNGVGMDEETLKHIFEKHKVNYHSNGVGVYNVQKRLQLYYGNDYGITYRSVKNQGTTATITIPKQQEAEHESI